MQLDNPLPVATSVNKTRPQVIWICLLAALAGLLFGLDIGVISGGSRLSPKNIICLIINKNGSSVQ
ncbi:hypothetical protein SB6421_04511 [Klebsiella huaxiensis]|nr:hypothetical protein SB6421_04511 [Klebsiella huaxiensis]